MLDILTVFYVIWFFISLLTFFCLLFFIKVPYGKHHREKWGPNLPNQLGWFFMEIPALLLFIIFFFSNITLPSLGALFLFILWCIHYLNRAIIFPFRLRTKGKKIPLIIVLSGILFNSINTFFIASYISKNATNYKLFNPNNWIFFIGILVFITGFFINNYSDHLLINLRAKGEVSYKIPRGFLFSYISCPNMFGEIIEWAGFALAANCIPSYLFLLWTMANLVPRSLSHHIWYNKQFKEYPRNRKAIFPFIL